MAAKRNFCISLVFTIIDFFDNFEQDERLFLYKSKVLDGFTTSFLNSLREDFLKHELPKYEIVHSSKRCLNKTLVKAFKLWESIWPLMMKQF